MSSRTAAWGQPPVSIARMREGARALWRVRNSASSLFWVSMDLDVFRCLSDVGLWNVLTL